MPPIPGTADASDRAAAQRSPDPLVNDGAGGSQRLSESDSWHLLVAIDAQIEQVMLSRQHPITGLLPASTANTVHGNYGDAWVRDCVYSIQCV